MMIDRRNIIVGLGVASVAGLTGCVDVDREAKIPLLDKITVAAFRVDATGAGNVIDDFVGDVGKDRIAKVLEAGLNEKLAGIGRGPETVTLSVKVKFVSLARTFLGTTNVQTQVFSGSASTPLAGRLAVAAKGDRTGTAEGELDRLVSAYIEEMRKLLVSS